MVNYETLILIHSEATNDEISKLERSFETLVSAENGSVNIFDKWGKCRLAYPVRKNDYGIYILVRYGIPKEKANSFFRKIHSLFKIRLAEVVLRYVNVILKKDAPLDYARPDSIDGPKDGGNLDAFLKENKMEGFLSNDNAPEKRSEDLSVEENSIEVDLPEKVNKDAVVEQEIEEKDLPEKEQEGDSV